jgi:hypothetical protein
MRGKEYHMVYAFHFKMLHQLRNFYYQQPCKKLIIYYYFLLSLIAMISRVQVGKENVLTHHGLIKLIICDALKGKI